MLVNPFRHLETIPHMTFSCGTKNYRYLDLRALTCSLRNLGHFKSNIVHFKSSGLLVFDIYHQDASGLCLDNPRRHGRSNTSSSPPADTRFSEPRSLTASSNNESSVRCDRGRLCFPLPMSTHSGIPQTIIRLAFLVGYLPPSSYEIKCNQIREQSANTRVHVS